MSLRPRRDPLSQMSLARTRMAPSGQRFSCSPIPRVGVRKMRQAATGYGWTQRTAIPTGISPEWMRGVAYGAGLWVAVGLQARVWTATDPAGTWSGGDAGTIESVDYADFCSVAYGDGVWVAVNSDNGKLYTASSPTGTWTPHTPFGEGNAAGSVAYGGGLWVGVGGGLWTATDPTGTWTYRTGLDSAVAICGVAYGGGVWTAVGAGAFPFTYTSTDPTGSWTLRSEGAITLGNAVDIAYGAGRWVIFDDGDGPNASWATDPTVSGEWTHVGTGFATGEWLRCAAYGNGVWAAFAPDASEGEARATATDPTIAAA